VALASNTKEQLAKRLKQDLEKLAPELSVSALQAAADGQPKLEVKDGATLLAICAIKRRTYKGFNVVAELSESAAEGLPEHECWVALKSSATVAQTAKLVKAASALGCSVLKLVSTAAAPVETDLVEASVTVELPNDARNGQVGQ
jgi:hypothetical protein